MTLLLINYINIDRLLSALSSTLLHSLWQGIILAALAGLIVIGTRKVSSEMRYNFLIVTLILFAVCVSATFVLQYQKIGIPAKTQHIIQLSQVSNTIITSGHDTNFSSQPQQVSFSERVNNYLNNFHNTIVLVWFLILCARTLQLAFGLYGTYRLRRFHVFSVDTYWMQRLQQLADSLNVNQAITMLESGLAKVPMVIGHLKPVILIPIGLLTALSAEEVEAILIHELAHIKRRDYLVNMLQSLMEIVFFFNPAVLWVSALIKTERENCCDDMVLAQNKNKLNYIRALVSCDQYRSSVPAYAMALPGNKNTLLSRAKRIASNHNYSLNVFEKTVLAVCLVALGLGVSAFSAREQIRKTIHSVVAAIHHETKVQSIQQMNTAKSVTTKKNVQVHIANDTLIKNKTQATELNQLANKIYQLSADSLKYTSPQFSEMAKSEYSILKNIQLLNKDSSGLLQNIARELYREHLLADTNHIRININERELVVNDVIMSRQVHDRIYRQFVRPGYIGNNKTPTYGINYSDSYGDNYSEKYPDTADMYRNPYAYPQLSNNERERIQDEIDKRLVADLLHDGLITDPNNVIFTMGDNKVTINGKIQSEEIYQKYKEKYMPAHVGPNWNWTYSHSEKK